MNSKSLLHHITIASFLLFTAPLHAALQIKPQQEVKVYDYTLKHHLDANASNEVASLDDLDLDDIPLELKALSKTDNSEDIQDQPNNLLALVLKHKQKESYTKYLFASTGLLKNRQAVNKAQDNYGYHLVQAYPNHCMLGVLAFLHQSTDYNVHTIVVHKSQPICTNCNLIAMKFFNQKLHASKQGCHGKPFPSPAPKLACACFHSSRFTHQQRHLSTLVDYFPKLQPQKKATRSNAYYRQGEILIPANGQCLYTSLLLGYLLPVRTNQQEYTRRYYQLTGKKIIPFPAKMLATYAADISILQTNFQCQQLVTNFMTYMKLERGKWGGKEEIQKIADYLHIHIQEYIPNPEHPTVRMRSDLTKPKDTTATRATITIHIVRDNPLVEEAELHAESVETAIHQQHYRLLYDLFKQQTTRYVWNSQAVQPNHDDSEDEGKDDEKEPSSVPFNEQITQSDKEDSEDSKEEDDSSPGASIIFLESDDAPASLEPSTTFRTKPLPLMIENNIIWQGRTTLNNKKKYCFLIQEKLYIFSEKPNDFEAKNAQSIIDLTKYELIPPSYKNPHTFYSQQQRRTAKESLIAHLKKSAQFNEDAIKEFGQWLENQDMDTDAILFDLYDNDDKAESNIQEKNNDQFYEAIKRSFGLAKDQKTITLAQYEAISSSYKAFYPKQQGATAKEALIAHLKKSAQFNKDTIEEFRQSLDNENMDTDAILFDLYDDDKEEESVIQDYEEDKNLGICQKIKDFFCTQNEISLTFPYEKDDPLVKKLAKLYNSVYFEKDHITLRINRVTSVSWSLDGKNLSSASDNKSVRIWDIATIKCTGHTDKVNNVSWSSNSKYVASASDDKSVRIWDGKTGKQLQLYARHRDRVNSVSWSPRGTRLASACHDKSVRIWNPANGKLLKEYTCEHYIHSVSWSPDGKYLALACCNSSKKIYNVLILNAAHGTLLHLYAGHRARVSSVSWSSNSTYVASASWDKSVRIWDAAKGTLFKELTGCTKEVNSVSWSPDREKWTSADYDDSVWIWDKNNELLKRITGHTDKVSSVSWSPDGEKLASASWDKSVRIWNAANGTLFKKITGHTDKVNSVSWSPDGEKLASASDDKSVRIWNAANGKLSKKITGHTDRVNSVSWSSNSKEVTSISCEGSVRIWNAASGKLLKESACHTKEINSVSWSPDGEYLASASFDKSMRIWEVATGKQLHRCAHPSWVRSVSWSPNGKYLASASGDMFSRDKSVRVWNATNGKQLDYTNDSDTRYTKDINSVSWSPDGKKLASASDDKSVYIHGAHIHAKDKNGNNALHHSCSYSDSLDMVIWLLDVCKIGIETKGEDKKTPFLCAAEAGQLDIAKLLRQRGANVKAKDAYRNNALHLACLSGKKAMIIWLLDVCKIGLETKGQHTKTPFLCALESGQRCIVKLLKKRGVNQNAKDKDGNNALHLACLSGSIQMAKCLLRVCKIEIETKRKDQKTPFLCAVVKGQCGIAQLLVKKGVNQNAKDKDGNNALHLACLSESIQMTKYLLRVCKIEIETKRKDQKTPFLFAANNGQIEIAKLLKEQGANVKAKDPFGNNAFHLVCLSGDETMANWLLDECEININEEGQDQKTPFLSAAEKGQLGIAKLLRRRGAKIIPKRESENNALHAACSFSGSEAMVTWLLDVCKISIETKGFANKTPFICAAERGELNIAQLLKKRGASINAKDIYEKNALHFACRDSSSVAMVTWLLDVCKISIETKGNTQQSPFLCAVQGEQLAIAKILKKRNADIHAKDAYGNNALDFACTLSCGVDMVTWLCEIGEEEKGHLEIAKLLRKGSANGIATDENGNNALHLACLFSGSAAMVKWLLDVYKIDIETKGFAQRTPFLCAAEKGHLQIAKLLKQRGDNIVATDVSGNSALHLACFFSGSVAMVTWLLNVCHIGLETTGQFQYTPFLSAVKRGQLAIAELLWQSGANILAKDQHGNNALHLACRDSGSKAMINWLLNVCHIGLETTGQFQYTPFLSAAKRGQLAIAELLRRRGANIHAKDQHGNNALHLACRYSGSKVMINWLLDRCKISLEAKGEYQKTPFLCAAEGGQVEIAILKERGANTKAVGKYGNNALHLACYFSGNEAMVNWLLDVCKINIETKGRYERTPFLCAVAGGQLGIAKLLVKKGANIQAKGEKKNNALHIACVLYPPKKAMVTWLLNEGVDKEAKNEDYLESTPLACAINQSEWEIVKLLIKSGANQRSIHIHLFWKAESYFSQKKNNKK